MDTKSPDAFRTISEVSERLDTPTHVLRFWESRFPQVRPVKRAGGRRYYRPADVALLGGIKKLLHDDGMTIRSVQKMLRDQGIRYVADLGAAVLGDEPEGEAGPSAAPTMAAPPRPETAQDARPALREVASPPPHDMATEDAAPPRAAIRIVPTPAQGVPDRPVAPVQADLFGSEVPAQDAGQSASAPTAIARRLRALTPERLRDIAPELTAIHARLVALRNRMADDGK
ncbi:MAG: MerR family transcriptional regulator [Paracoccaceae bacterium]|nr:MerR family transcriptional regulator [Paracoccaceae bacterium]